MVSRFSAFQQQLIEINDKSFDLIKKIWSSNKTVEADLPREDLIIDYFTDLII